jgi:Kef-type K+ transport system membrane component KefB
LVSEPLPKVGPVFLIDVGVVIFVIRCAAASGSLACIVLPFTAGFLLGQFLPASILPDSQHRLIVSLFLGTALSISSVKIVAVVVRDMGFMRRNNHCLRSSKISP